MPLNSLTTSGTPPSQFLNPPAQQPSILPPGIVVGEEISNPGLECTPDSNDIQFLSFLIPSGGAAILNRIVQLAKPVTGLYLINSFVAAGGAVLFFVHFTQINWKLNGAAIDNSTSNNALVPAFMFNVGATITPGGTMLKFCKPITQFFISVSPSVVPLSDVAFSLALSSDISKFDVEGP